MPRYFLLPAAQGKRAVLSGLFFFVCSQALLGVYLHRCHPELCDPVFGNRLRSLRARIAQSPGAPLVLILGSSRPMNGLWPGAFHLQSSRPGPSPLIYNFAVSGAGHVGELFNFRHLLADGIRPDWVLIETWPPVWCHSEVFDDKHGVVHYDLGIRDVPILHRYYPQEHDLLGQALEGSLVPLLAHRTRLLGATAPFLLPRLLAWRFANDMGAWIPADGTGWMPVQTPPHTPESRQQELELGRKNIRPLVNPLSIDFRRDHALHELLDECRARGIKAALFVMPEHSEVRRWYSPQARALINSYLASIGREYQIPIIDTRDWAPDEGFADAAHMERSAAAPFSERFGRDVLQPLLEGTPLKGCVLFGGGAQTP
jgi:hypothetical protein